MNVAWVVFCVELIIVAVVVGSVCAAPRGGVDFSYLFSSCCGSSAEEKKINRESIEACCFLKSNGRRNEKGQSQKFSHNIKFTVFNALEEENATVH